VLPYCPPLPERRNKKDGREKEEASILLFAREFLPSCRGSPLPPNKIPRANGPPFQHPLKNYSRIGHLVKYWVNARRERLLKRIRRFEKPAHVPTCYRRYIDIWTKNGRMIPIEGSFSAEEASPSNRDIKGHEEGLARRCTAIGYARFRGSGGFCGISAATWDIALCVLSFNHR